MRSSFVNILNPGHHYSCTINNHSYRCKMGVKRQSGSQQYSTYVGPVIDFFKQLQTLGTEVHKQQDKNEFDSYLYPIQKLPTRVYNKAAKEFFTFWINTITTFSPSTEFTIIFLQGKKKCLQTFLLQKTNREDVKLCCPYFWGNTGNYCSKIFEEGFCIL